MVSPFLLTSLPGWSGYADTSSDPCNSGWQGVVCASSDFASNHVVSIALPNNNVTGTIPSSISALSKLTALNLGGNGLHGSTPSTLTSVPLVSLSLAGNTNVTLPVAQLPGFTALL